MPQKVSAFLVWLLATLFVVYSFCLNTAAAVFIDSIKVSLHLSNLEATLATSVFILSFALMQIPAGFLLDKYPAKYVVSLGIIVLAMGNLMISFASNLFTFSVANFIQGIGASFAFTAAAILISQWFGKKNFPIMFGLTQTLSCISAALVHYYMVMALMNHSWNDIYRKISVFGFLLFVLALLFLRSPQNYPRESGVSLRNSLSLLFKNNQILLCCLAAATSFGVLLAYASLWYLKVQDYYSVSNQQSIIISGMIFLGIGIGTPLLGWISNVVKSRVMIIHITLVLGTMFLLLGLYLPHFNLNTLAIIKTVSFLIGFFLSGSMLFFALVNELAPAKTQGVAISLLNTVIFVFNTLILFIPYLFITTKSIQFFTYLWVLPFSVLFSLLLVYFIKDPV